MKKIKLNNKGWGLAAYIFYSAMLLLALLLAAYLIYIFYNSFGL